MNKAAWDVVYKLVHESGYPLTNDSFKQRLILKPVIIAAIRQYDGKRTYITTKKNATSLSLEQLKIAANLMYQDYVEKYIEGKKNPEKEPVRKHSYNTC